MSKPPSKLAMIRDALVVAVISALTVQGMRKWVGDRYLVPSDSMQPVLYGDPVPEGLVATSVELEDDPEVIVRPAVLPPTVERRILTVPSKAAMPPPKEPAELEVIVESSTVKLPEDSMPAPSSSAWLPMMLLPWLSVCQLRPPRRFELVLGAPRVRRKLHQPLVPSQSLVSALSSNFREVTTILLT